MGAEAVNWKFIILAIILIGVVINVSGIVFCMADNLIAVGVADAVSILVGLTLVGCMTPENRWRNIILVAAGVWVTDVLPAAIGTISLSFSGWMGSIVWYANNVFAVWWVHRIDPIHPTDKTLGPIKISIFSVTIDAIVEREFPTCSGTGTAQHFVVVGACL